MPAKKKGARSQSARRVQEQRAASASADDPVLESNEESGDAMVVDAAERCLRDVQTTGSTFDVAGFGVVDGTAKLEKVLIGISSACLYRSRYNHRAC